MAKSNTYQAARLLLLVGSLALAVHVWSGGSAGAQGSLTPYQQMVVDDGATFYVTFDDTSSFEAALVDQVGGLVLERNEFDEFAFSDANEVAIGSGASFGFVAPPEQQYEIGGLTLPLGPEAELATLFTGSGSVEAFVWSTNEEIEIAGGPGFKITKSSPDSEETVTLFYRDGSGPQSISSVPNALEQDAWSHVVATHETDVNPIPNLPPQSGTVKLFINGAEVAAGQTDGNLFRTSTFENFAFRALLLVDQQGDYTIEAGRIDELAVYRRALSVEEVAAHYELSGLGVVVEPIPDAIALGYMGVNEAPFDRNGESNSNLFPYCLAQLTGRGFCFTALGERERYITTELIGEPQFGTIWLGRFDEEVVAP